MTAKGQKQKRHTIPGVHPYKTPAGRKRWAVVLDDGKPGSRHQTRKRGFATQDAAAIWRANFLSRRHRGEVGEPSQIPFGSYAERWLEARSAAIRPGTARIYRGALRIVSGHLDAIPLARITPTLIERMYVDLRRRYRPGTVRHAHVVVRMVFRTAMRDGLLSRDPSIGVVTPAPDTEPRIVWTADLARTFLAGTADDHWSDAWHVFLECWLRSGELRALRWSDCDLAGGTLTVSRTATSGQDTGPPKTASSRRTITLSPGLCARLKARRVEQMRAALEEGRGWSDDRLVFPGPDGGIVHKSTISRALERACRRLGVPYPGIHGLRHTGGSLAYGDMPTKLITERMGHARVSITEDIYVHTNPEQHRKLAETIADLLAM